MKGASIFYRMGIAQRALLALALIVVIWIAVWLVLT